jgi:type IV fimbrial biogenesis protein FimT
VDDAQPEHVLDAHEGGPMLTRTHSERGFKLIEMLIGIGIVALLFKLAVPSFRTWQQNTQIRGAAHAIADGMNIARGEAIRRNVQVQLQLTSLGNGNAAAWTVSELPAPNGTGAVVQSWSSAQGASGTQIVQAGGGILTFNPLGRVVAPNPINNSAPLLQVDITSNNDASDPALRTMRVVVGNGGAARMCDPHLAQPDPRAC